MLEAALMIGVVYIQQIAYTRTVTSSVSAEFQENI